MRVIHPETVSRNKGEITTQKIKEFLTKEDYDLLENMVKTGKTNNANLDDDYAYDYAYVYAFDFPVTSIGFAVGTVGIEMIEFCWNPKGDFVENSS